MPKSLADGRIKISIMTAKPVDPYKTTVAELNAGIDAACRIVSTDYNLGATASETVNEKALCQEGNATTPTTSNYEGSFTVFRYFDPVTGKAESAATGPGGDVGDAVFQALKMKGSRVWIAQRFTSKKSTDAWAAGDEIEVFEVVTDNPQSAGAEGYIKKKISLFVQDAWLNGEVATAG